jgi:ribosomal protein S6--L-glutamate ligase
MKIGILYHSTINTIPKDTITLSKAFKKKNVDLQFLNVHKLSFIQKNGKLSIYNNQQRLPKMDIVITRLNTQKRPLLFSYVTTLFKASGATVINGWPAGRVANKIVEHAESIEAKIPMPNWAIAKRTPDILSAAKKIGYPLMVKVPVGSKGNGVFYVKNKQELVQLAGYLTTSQKGGLPIILESFIEEANNTDIRVFVVGDAAVAGMKRVAKKGEKRANISVGGSVKNVKLTKEEQELAVKATLAYGLDIAGVDVMRTKNGPVVIEVNSIPGGFKSLKKLCGIDVPKLIYQFAIKKCKENEKK